MKYKLTHQQKTIFIYTILSVIAVVLFLFFMLNLKNIGGFINVILSAFKSVIAGLIIAYFFVKPINFLEKRWTKRRLKKNKKLHPKLMRTFSILIVYISLLALITGFVWFVIPQFVQSLSALVRNFSSYAEAVDNYVSNFFNNLNVSINEGIMNALTDNLEKMFNQAINSISSIAPQAWKATTGVLAGLITFFMGLVVSIYFIASKESLIKNFRRFVLTVFPKKVIKISMRIINMADDFFIKYFTGRIIDSVIVTILTFIVISIFQMPYSFLISVIVGVTNILPIIGPYLGGIPSVFIVLITGNPLKALILALIIIGIQQLDGNFIDPKITGKRTGLSGFWVLISVLVSTSLFGIPGVLLCVPTVSVAFVLMEEYSNRKLSKKGLPLGDDPVYTEKTIAELNDMTEDSKKDNK